MGGGPKSLSCKRKRGGGMGGGSKLGRGVPQDILEDGKVGESGIPRWGGGVVVGRIFRVSIFTEARRGTPRDAAGRRRVP